MLRPYLEQLTEAEGVTVEPAVFPLVVRAGGGSARDTLSVLDQLIAGAGPEGVTYARAVALLGVTDVALIDEMCDALAAGDGAAAYATIDRVAEAGHDPRRFASDLLERLRDLIVLQQVPDAVAKGLIDGPADQLERMAAQADAARPGDAVPLRRHRAQRPGRDARHHRAAAAARADHAPGCCCPARTTRPARCCSAWSAWSAALLAGRSSSCSRHRSRRPALTCSRRDG